MAARSSCSACSTACRSSPCPPSPPLSSTNARACRRNATCSARPRPTPTHPHIPTSLSVHSMPWCPTEPYCYYACSAGPPTPSLARRFPLRLPPPPQGAAPLGARPTPRRMPSPATPRLAAQLSRARSRRDPWPALLALAPIRNLPSASRRCPPGDGLCLAALFHPRPSRVPQHPPSPPRLHGRDGMAAAGPTAGSRR